MRFGVIGMQLKALLNTAPKAGAPPSAEQFASFEFAPLARNLAQAGFDPIELGGDLPMFLPHTLQPAAVERLQAVQAELGIRYTVHLPLWSVEPSTPLEPVRAGSVAALTQIVRAVEPLQPECYVLHATGALAAEFYRMGLPEGLRQVVLRQFQGQAQRSIAELLAATGLPSRKLAIETIEFPFELTLEMAEELDLSLCFDTGHVLVGFSGPVDFFTALEACLPRLAEVHLHDAPRYDPAGPLAYGQDHQPLGRGDLETGRLLDSLAAASFAGPVVFELPVEGALASLQEIRQIRPGLFEQNGL